MVTPQRPAFGDPAPASVSGLPRLDRQHVARDGAEAAIEHTGHARAFGRVFKFVGFRRDVDRQLTLGEEEVRRVFVSRNTAFLS